MIYCSSLFHFVVQSRTFEPNRTSIIVSPMGLVSDGPEKLLHAIQMIVLKRKVADLLQQNQENPWKIRLVNRLINSMLLIIHCIFGELIAYVACCCCT